MEGALQDQPGHDLGQPGGQAQGLHAVNQLAGRQGELHVPGGRHVVAGPDQQVPGLVIGPREKRGHRQAAGIARAGSNPMCSARRHGTCFATQMMVLATRVAGHQFSHTVIEMSFERVNWGTLL